MPAMRALNKCVCLMHVLHASYTLQDACMSPREVTVLQEAFHKELPPQALASFPITWNAKVCAWRGSREGTFTLLKDFVACMRVVQVRMGTSEITWGTKVSAWCRPADGTFTPLKDFVACMRVVQVRVALPRPPGVQSVCGTSKTTWGAKVCAWCRPADGTFTLLKDFVACMRVVQVRVALPRPPGVQKSVPGADLLMEHLHIYEGGPGTNDTFTQLNSFKANARDIFAPLKKLCGTYEGVQHFDIIFAEYDIILLGSASMPAEGPCRHHVAAWLHWNCGLSCPYDALAGRHYTSRGSNHLIMGTPLAQGLRGLELENVQVADGDLSDLGTLFPFIERLHLSSDTGCCYGASKLMEAVTSE
eukprot:1158457-Pelagomonas_calceolata.AAC.5